MSNSPINDPSPAFRSAARRDAFILGVALMCALILSVCTDPFEIIYSINRAYPEMNLANLSTVAMLAGFGFAWFAWRRWREFAEESAERSEAMSKLTLANIDLQASAVEIQRAYEELGRQAIGLEEAAHDIAMARDAATAANRAKSEFLANMSHELRTPLNAIIGFSEIMEAEMFGPVGSAQYRGYATDILNSGRHLLHIINEILDLSKIEAGRMELNLGKVQLSEILHACERLILPRAQEASLTIRMDIAPAIVSLGFIMADETRLKRLFLNLLSNAVKFTPPGGRITTRAEIEETSSGSFIRIEVEDTGIGMDELEVALALEPFRQVDNSLSRRHEGAGLGLPIAKALAEMHDGSLHIDSIPGQGTLVTVILPVNSAEARLDSVA